MFLYPARHRLIADRRGSALVEFALVLPLLAAFLLGITAYGQYFLVAHNAQQLANDAARATVSGLNATERNTLAQASVSSGVTALGTITPSRVTTTVTETSGRVAVTVRVDASQIGLLRTPILPMPDPVIERRAVIQPGGIQ